MLCYNISLSPPPIFSPTDESLHEWLLDTLSDPQNKTDYLNSCALSDDRNRSNSFDTMIRNGCFDAVMLSDSSFDSTMMWDAGMNHHSEEAFQDFGMHKPWLYLSNSLFVNTMYHFWDDFVRVNSSAICTPHVIHLHYYALCRHHYIVYSLDLSVVSCM